MAHDEQREAVRDRSAGQRQAISGRGGRLNEQRERTLMLEEPREAGPPGDEDRPGRGGRAAPVGPRPKGLPFPYAPSTARHRLPGRGGTAGEHPSPMRLGGTSGRIDFADVVWLFTALG